MAPRVPFNSVKDLSLSSLELEGRSTVVDIIAVSSKNIFKRDDSNILSSASQNLHQNAARDNSPAGTPNHSGAINPNDINMKGIQALFAIIGVAMALGTVWFFFWAKNGGFQWRKGDWDDYKSTVLRRKGPNGTTLSNASKSTKLGGGSVVPDGFSDGTSQWGGTMTTESMTDLSSEAPVLKEKRKAKKETAKDRKIREAQTAEWEGGNDQDVRAYMREKPARVGGLNKSSEALYYGTDYTDTEGSAVHVQNHRSTRTQPQPPQQPIPSRQPSPEKRQSRRDFSYTNEDTFSTVSSSQPEAPVPTYPDLPPQAPPHRPGRYHSPSKQQDAHWTGQYPRGTVPGAYQESNSAVQAQNTKTYHHVIPGLNSPSPAPSPNQQARGGYRRDRRDSFD